MIRSMTLMVCCALVPCVGADDAQKPREVTMVVTPAAEQNLGLAHRLWPDPALRTPGNAAVMYARAFGPDFQGARRDWPTGERLEKLLVMPLAELKASVTSTEREQLTGKWSLYDLDYAARKRTVDWELWDRIRDEGFALLLPELQGYRQFARWLALKARLQMAAGDFAGAARSLETGLSLGHDLAESPTLIHALVGIACAQQAVAQLEDWVQTPGAPNIYWALTELPTPLVDVRNGFSGERAFIDSFFPGVRDRINDPNQPPMSPEQAREIYTKLTTTLNEGKSEGILDAVAFTTMGLPKAKKFFADRGWTEAQINAQPALQLVMMHEVAIYDRGLNELIRITGLPFPERLARAAAIEKEDRSQTTVSRLLLPAPKVHAAPMRLLRRIAALRVVEALRMHAAKTGELPATLADVKVVYIPTDPATGSAFQYRRDGATAVLSGGPVVNDIWGNSAFEFKISLAK